MMNLGSNDKDEDAETAGETQPCSSVAPEERHERAELEGNQKPKAQAQKPAHPESESAVGPEDDDQKRKSSEGDDGDNEEGKGGDSSSSEDEGYILDQERFPDKVRWLLDEKVAPEAFWWLPEGDGFAVQKDAVTMPLLIKHFRGNRFSSVMRNFNRWGFRRVPDERVPEGVLGYTHDKFIKGRPGLMKKIKKEVYVKKEKDETKEGDKRRPRKRARLKAPPQAPPAAGLSGSVGRVQAAGGGSVGGGSVNLQHQLSADLMSSSAVASAQRRADLPQNILGALSTQGHSRAGDSSNLAQHMALLHGMISGGQQNPTALSVAQLPNQPLSDSSRRLNSQQDTNQAGDMMSRLSGIDNDQLAYAQAAQRLADLQAASSAGDQASALDPIFTILAASRGNQAFLPSSATSNRSQQLPGLQSSVLGVGAGNLDQDLLMQLARHRQFAAHQAFGGGIGNIPSSSSSSPFDLSDPLVRQLLSSSQNNSRVRDQLLSNTSSAMQRNPDQFAQELMLRHHLSQQLGGGVGGGSQLQSASLHDANSSTSLASSYVPIRAAADGSTAGSNSHMMSRLLAQQQQMQQLPHSSLLGHGQQALSRQQLTGQTHNAFNPSILGMQQQMSLLGVPEQIMIQRMLDEELAQRERSERERQEEGKGGT